MLLNSGGRRSHLTTQMFKKELIGDESAELTKLVRKYADLA